MCFETSDQTSARYGCLCFAAGQSANTQSTIILLLNVLSTSCTHLFEDSDKVTSTLFLLSHQINWWQIISNNQSNNIKYGLLECNQSSADKHITNSFLQSKISHLKQHLLVQFLPYPELQHVVSSELVEWLCFLVQAELIFLHLCMHPHNVLSAPEPSSADTALLCQQGICQELQNEKAISLKYCAVINSLYMYIGYLL